LCFMMRKTLTAAAKIMKNQDAFFKSPKAVPVFNTCEIETRGKSIELFNGINFKTKNFVILSRRKTNIATFQKFSSLFSISADTDSRPFSPISQDAAKQFPIAL